MDDQISNDNDFASGFLIKDKSGQFKKVEDDKVVEISQPPRSVPAKIPPVVAPKITLTAEPPVKEIRSPGWPILPATPISSSGRAPLMLEPEDEAEIKKHTQDLKQLFGSARPSVSGGGADPAIQKVIASLALQFDNEIMSKRFAKIMESRQKDIRSSIETQEILSRDKKIGGLGMTEELAGKSVKALEEEMAANIEKKADAGPGLAAVPFAPAASAVMPKPEKPKPFYPAAPPSFIPLPKKTVAPAPMPGQQEKPLVKPAERAVPAAVMPVQMPSPAVVELYKKPAGTEMNRIAKARQLEPQRPQVVDIRLPSKVLGPIEELADIDPKEFRRLGTNPKEATEKILEKIYLLEEESWQMKMDGVKAWRASPVYKIYVALGRESLDNNSPINLVIQKRMNDGKPYLMFEEFTAINELNSRLI